MRNGRRKSCLLIPHSRFSVTRFPGCFSKPAISVATNSAIAPPRSSGPKIALRSRYARSEVCLPVPSQTTISEPSLPMRAKIAVCEGTGKQTSLRAYLDRKAILGPDDRGGAMALLVATEMAAWK